jgi:hypothetical protein
VDLFGPKSKSREGAPPKKKGGGPIAAFGGGDEDEDDASETEEEYSVAFESLADAIGIPEAKRNRARLALKDFIQSCKSSGAEEEDPEEEEDEKSSSSYSDFK